MLKEDAIESANNNLLMWKRNACKKKITQFISYVCEQSLDKMEFSFTDYLTAMMFLSFFTTQRIKGLFCLNKSLFSRLAESEAKNWLFCFKPQKLMNP